MNAATISSISWNLSWYWSWLFWHRFWIYFMVRIIFKLLNAHLILEERKVDNTMKCVDLPNFAFRCRSWGCLGNIKIKRFFTDRSRILCVLETLLGKFSKWALFKPPWHGVEAAYPVYKRKDDPLICFLHKNARRGWVEPRSLW